MGLAALLSLVLVFINLFVVAFNAILIIRIVLSLLVPDLRGNWLGRLLIDLTEPVLAPVRRILPKGGMFDWAPMVTIFGLYALRTLVFALLFRS